MCGECSEEYNDPLNRRYHAQPNSCSKCGPELRLTNNKGERCVTDNPVKTAVDLLKNKKIIAVKGLGGFHLISDARDKQVIAKLRRRKKRPDKPLALMMDNVNTVKKYCELNRQEKKILTGIKKPILLLNKKFHTLLPKNIAPGSRYYGVMLPYTPLHYLLLNYDVKVIIATSANISGTPIEYENDNAFKNIKNIADYFLFHNRDINIPIDDSLARVSLGKLRILRRARGYVPEPVHLDGINRGIEDKKVGLALGADQKNTICYGWNDYAFMS